jgi:hypothetical protein
MKSLPLKLLFAGVLAVGANSVKAQVVIGQNFTGTNINLTFQIPPDTDGAVGLNHYVELVNGRFQVYNKANGVAVQSKGLNQFWSDAGVATGSSFDPRIIYDHNSGRWFAAAADNGESSSSNFLVAVSTTSDPTGAWKAFAIKADATNTDWADFPTLGLDRDGVYISANMFAVSNNNFDAIKIISIPKADLTAAVPTIANRTTFNGLNPATVGFAVQPIVDFGPSKGRAPLLAVSDLNFTQLNRTNILGAGAAGATLSGTTNIAVSTMSFPPNAAQPDGTSNLDTGDNRISASVVEQGTSLWAVQPVAFGGRSAVRWYQIDEPTNTVLQSGTISDSQFDYYYPSINVNSFGEVIVGFSRSGLNPTTGFASSVAVAGTTTGGVTTFGSPILLKSGVANYHFTDGSGTNRWGDYSATTLDPNDPHSFWTIQEWASANNQWSTQITQLTFTTQSVPEPGSLALLGAGVVCLSGFALRRRRTS